MQTPDKFKVTLPAEDEPWQYSPVAALRPKRRSKVEETPAPVEPPAAPEPAPAPIAAPPRTPPGRMKRSGTPHQTWKVAPEPAVSVPSRSLSAQQLVEWLTRSPFFTQGQHLRHSHSH